MRLPVWCPLLLCVLPVPRALVAQRELRLIPEVTIDGRVHGLEMIGFVGESDAGDLALSRWIVRHFKVFSPTGMLRRSYRNDSVPEADRFEKTTLAVGWRGDTLLVNEWKDRTFWFAPDGRLVRKEVLPQSIRMAGGPEVPLPKRWTVSRAFSSGRRVITFQLDRQIVEPIPPIPGIDATTGYAAVLVDAEARFVRLLATISQREKALCWTYDGVTTIPYLIPFCVDPNLSISPDGARIMRTTPIGTDRLRLVVSDVATGDTLLRIERRGASRPIPKARSDAMRAVIERSGLKSEARRAYERELAWPTHFPSFSGATFGDDGSIWIGEYPMTDDAPRRYQILAADGRDVGRLTLLVGATLWVRRVDHIWISRPNGPPKERVEDFVRMRIR